MNGQSFPSADKRSDQVARKPTAAAYVVCRASIEHEATFGYALGGFSLPALFGNVIGGTAIVAALGDAQLAASGESGLTGKGLA